MRCRPALVTVLNLSLLPWPASQVAGDSAAMLQQGARSRTLVRVSQRRSLRARASGLALSGNLPVGRAQLALALACHHGPQAGRDSPGAGWPFSAAGGHMGGQHPPRPLPVQAQHRGSRAGRGSLRASITVHLADMGTRGASGRRPVAETAGVASATGTGVPTGRGLSGSSCEFRSLAQPAVYCQLASAVGCGVDSELEANRATAVAPGAESRPG
jgi:hypothetical protein